jgi:hypothetical protein
MKDDRHPLPVAILIALLRASPMLAWGGAMLWWGMRYDGPPIPGQGVGPYSFHLFGALLIGIALIGVAIIVMRARAPRKRADRIIESEEQVFDADAAIQNYLASKKEADLAQAPKARELAARPVFGRRGV